jgi:methionyl-tRNA formyltransferase
MKVRLYLMTIKGYNVLKELVVSGFDNFISNVVIGTDRQIQNDYSKDILDLCISRSITYSYHNDNISLSEDCTYGIAISWRWIIRDSKINLIVFHDSILPKYRGFTPLVNMLINKEPIIGVTAFHANDSFDKGPIISSLSITVNYPIRIIDALNHVSSLYGKLAVDIFGKIIYGDYIDSIPQIESEATYSVWRDDLDYFIDWKESADYIHQFVLSLSYPYKGAAAFERRYGFLRIHDCIPVPDLDFEIRDVGKVFCIENGDVVVICGVGLLKITDMRDDSDNKIKFDHFRLRFMDSYFAQMAFMK